MTGDRTASQSNRRKITLIVLGLLAAATVFLLPQFVDKPWVDGGVTDLPAVPEPRPTDVAPSTAAELTRWRQESQGVLAEIVAIRDRLREQGVETWAAAEFANALDRVETGDERYSYGDYAASLENYRRARESLAGIEATGQQKLADAKRAALEAIEALNGNVAADSVGLAQVIAPGDPEVRQLAARAETLAAVAQHLEAGDQAMERDRFDAARDEYRRATELDPAHRRAAESLAAARTAVTGDAYRARMSRGFAAMERGDFDGARTAFREAGKIRPGDPAVQQALDQADNREAQRHVDRELERAAGYESGEDWAQALAVYEGLLEQDPSLTEARVRLIPARVRTDLDARMRGYIAEPLKLSASESAYLAAQGTLADARGIPNPGPKLAGQIERLDVLLKAANTPVEVVLRSDNQTHVVLYRIRDLGRFEQVSLRLRPGKYVVAGTRQGFRDVRVEFTVTGTEALAPVVVRCEEPIG